MSSWNWGGEKTRAAACGEGGLWEEGAQCECPSELQWEPVGSGCSSVNMFEENIHSAEDRKYTEPLVCPDSGNRSPVYPRKSVRRRVGTQSTGRASFQEMSFCLGGGGGGYLRVWEALRDLLWLCCKVLSLLPFSGTFMLRRQCLKIHSCEYLLI